MNFNPIPSIQLPLFVYGEPTEDIHEVLPAIWSAIESLTSPGRTIRNQGIDELLALGVQRISPLVAYVLATTLNDADILIRRRVAYILGDLIDNEQSASQTAGDVRKTVTNYLQNMHEKTIYDLLEVAVMDPLLEKSIYHIFNACPFAGKYLGEISSQWKNPLAIRRKAIYYVGLVGYTEAIPILERLLNRLEARQSEQYTMSFVPASTRHDDGIIPSLRIAIIQLRAH